MLRTCLLFALLIQHGLAVVVELNCETLDDEFSTPITNVKLSTYLPALLTFMRQCEVSDEPAMLTKNHPFSIGEESTGLPEECYTQNFLDADNRRVSNGEGGGGEFCDCGSCNNADWKGDNWYRFDDDSKMPENPVSGNACGSLYPIHLVGSHPTEVGQVSATFNNYLEEYHGFVTNCASYYVYYLTNTADYCDASYCADIDIANDNKSLKALKAPPKPVITEERKELMKERMERRRVRNVTYG